MNFSFLYDQTYCSSNVNFAELLLQVSFTNSSLIDLVISTSYLNKFLVCLIFKWIQTGYFNDGQDCNNTLFLPRTGFM